MKHREKVQALEALLNWIGEEFGRTVTDDDREHWWLVLGRQIPVDDALSHCIAMAKYFAILPHYQAVAEKMEELGLALTAGDPEAAEGLVAWGDEGVSED